ncbi:MAG: dihydropteroate synthase [Candidatus Melainabacteria bacterium]|nr:MAG: dihydropteroate synthase [Candidatus Melainabacteria bacterium]
MKQIAKLIENNLNQSLQIWQIKDKVFDFQNKKYVMGILNVTPDSFSDGGLFLKPKEALEQVELMIENGIDILDIGAESTRPGAKRS